MRLTNYLTVNNAVLLFIMICSYFISTYHPSEIEWTGDDILHLQIIKGSIWDTIKANYTNNTHPIGYFLYAKLFYSISNDYYFMRLSSVLPAIISIPLFYLLIKKHTNDENIALFCSSLWAFDFLVVNVSDDIRQYTLLLMLCVIYLLTFLPKNKTEFYIHFIVAFCMIFTHYSSIILIFCGGLITFAHLYFKSLKKLLLYVLLYGIIGIVFLIDLYLKKHFYLGFEADELFAKNVWLYDGYPRRGEIGHFVFNLLLIMFEHNPFFNDIKSFDIQIVILALSSSLICLGLIYSFKNQKSHFYFYTSIIAVMLILAIFVMFPISCSRHTLFFLPIKLLVLSYGLKIFFHRSIFLLVSTITLCLASVFYYATRPLIQLTRTDFANILSDVKQTIPPTKTIFTDPTMLDHFQYQLNNQDLCLQYQDIHFCSHTHVKQSEIEIGPITVYGLKHYLESIKHKHKSKNVTILNMKFINLLSITHQKEYLTEKKTYYYLKKLSKMGRELMKQGMIYNVKTWYSKEKDPKTNKHRLIGLMYTLKDIGAILEHPLFKQALEDENRYKQKYYYGYSVPQN